MSASARSTGQAGHGVAAAWIHRHWIASSTSRPVGGAASRFARSRGALRLHRRHRVRGSSTTPACARCTEPRKASERRETAGGRPDRAAGRPVNRTRSCAGVRAMGPPTAHIGECRASAYGVCDSRFSVSRIATRFQAGRGLIGRTVRSQARPSWRRAVVRTESPSGSRGRWVAAHPAAATPAVGGRRRLSRPALVSCIRASVKPRTSPFPARATRCTGTSRPIRRGKRPSGGGRL